VEKADPEEMPEPAGDAPPGRGEGGLGMSRGVRGDRALRGDLESSCSVAATAFAAASAPSPGSERRSTVELWIGTASEARGDGRGAVLALRFRLT
jgi:hypothetical protein